MGDEDTIHGEQVGAHSWLIVGNARYPAELKSEDIAVIEYPFRIRQAKVYFENGFRVSVVWGSCTYSDNQHDHQAFTEAPCRVEVAVLWDGPWEPLARVSADQLNAILQQVARWHTGTVPPDWVQEGGYLDGDPA